MLDHNDLPDNRFVTVPMLRSTEHCLSQNIDHAKMNKELIDNTFIRSIGQKLAGSELSF